MADAASSVSSHTPTNAPTDGPTDAPPNALGIATLQDSLASLRAGLRPGQQRMADWLGGPLAVSAVPGAGKSTGMAIAAAIVLAQRWLEQAARSPDPSPTTLPEQAQNLIVVTFTRSAAANLKTKIRETLRQLSLPPVGFSVYTLHGLALHIAQRHPEQSGLNLDQMTLMTPTQGHRLIRSAVERWIVAHPNYYQRLIEGQFFDGEETERLRRQSVLRTEVLPQLTATVISEAKSSGLSPDQLRHFSQSLRWCKAGSDSTSDYEVMLGNDLLAIATGLFDQYQQVQRQRNTVDYDDMMVAALRVLAQDDIRQWWQSHIFAVFEDEAQDSSPLQTQLLQILAHSSTAPHPPSATVGPNLIRIGDPNQAINATFTPADPIFFREFCVECDRHGRLAAMTQAGRSSPVIMDAANFLLDWLNQRYAFDPPPFRPQRIEPVANTDPQPDANPAPIGAGLELHRPPTIVHTVARIAKRISQVFQDNPNNSLAILVRENRQGQFVADCLRSPQKYNITTDLAELGLAIYEVGERGRQSVIPAEMLDLLRFLDRPHSPSYLKAAMQVLTRRQLIPGQDVNAIATVPEAFLYPGPLELPASAEVTSARRYCSKLLKARLELPAHQLIPFLAFSLQYDQTELATADKLCDRLRQETAFDPSLTALLTALTDLATTEQFTSVDTEQAETQYTRPGQVTIITMHKAKGLDWDAVFLPFLHDKPFETRSWVPPQTQFLGPLSLSDVAKAQIRYLVRTQLYPAFAEDTTSTAVAETPADFALLKIQASQQRIAEECRLLYVAMTRAKRLLWMAAAHQAPFTWRKPSGLTDSNPAPALVALMDHFPGVCQP